MKASYEVLGKSRIEYIDLVRGISIVIMILGHLGLGETFDHFIHTFHMPMKINGVRPHKINIGNGVRPH